jgi:hypothetical protein
MLLDLDANGQLEKIVEKTHKKIKHRFWVIFGP